MTTDSPAPRKTSRPRTDIQPPSRRKPAPREPGWRPSNLDDYTSRSTRRGPSEAVVPEDVDPGY